MAERKDVFILFPGVAQHTGDVLSGVEVGEKLPVSNFDGVKCERTAGRKLIRVIL